MRNFCQRRKIAFLLEWNAFCPLICKQPLVFSIQFATSITGSITTRSICSLLGLTQLLAKNIHALHEGAEDPIPSPKYMVERLRNTISSIGRVTVDQFIRRIWASLVV